MPSSDKTSFDPDNEAVSVLEWWLSNRLPSEELGIRIADELRKAHAIGVHEGTREMKRLLDAGGFTR